MENTKEHIINDVILSYFKDFSWGIIKENPNLEGWLYSNLLLSLEPKTIIIQIKCNNDSNFENKLVKKELELDYTKPIIFLKFNPCHSNSSNPIESCWEKNIFGLYVLKQNRKQEEDPRQSQVIQKNTSHLEIKHRPDTKRCQI